jgi:proteasome lid subunit RPN8/RPN11
VTVLLTAGELEAVHRHARADYPAECCGVVLVRPGDAGERRLLPCRNIQDELHAREPARFPRTARSAYYIAHQDLLEIGRREAEGFEVRVIYHSHVDTGAYFSETDRRNAMVDGEPAYPTATYVVVGVAHGRVSETRAHRWSAETGEFVEVPLVAGEDSVRAESRGERR